MRKDLSIYLREQLIIDKEFYNLIEESEAYPTTKVAGSGKNGVSYTFIAKDLESKIIKVAPNNIDCKQTGTDKKDVKYKISFYSPQTIQGLSLLNIMFEAIGYPLNANVGGGPQHFQNVMKTVIEAAKDVSKDYGVRFFGFAGVQDSNEKKCMGGKYVNQEENRRKKMEAKGVVYKRDSATRRTKAYVWQSNSASPGSTHTNGNNVIVDMGVLHPEIFDESEYSDCAKFALLLQKEGIENVLRSSRNITCSGDGKIERFSKMFTFKGEKYHILVDSSYNVSLKDWGGGEVIDTYSADSIEDMVSKISDYENNPIIDIDVRDIMSKLENQLLGGDFKVLDTSESAGKLIVTYKHVLSDVAYINLVLSEDENSINVKIEELEDLGDWIPMKTDELSTINSKKIIDFIFKFKKEIKPTHEKQIFFNLSIKDQIVYLVNKPTIPFEYELLLSMFGEPSSYNYDANIGYDMRYRTVLDGGKTMYEDFKNDEHQYEYIVKILDENVEQTFFKAYDAITIKEMLDTRTEFINTISDQMNEGRVVVKNIFRNKLKIT